MEEKECICNEEECECGENSECNSSCDCGCKDE